MSWFPVLVFLSVVWVMSVLVGSVVRCAILVLVIVRILMVLVFPGCVRRRMGVIISGIRGLRAGLVTIRGVLSMSSVRVALRLAARVMIGRFGVLVMRGGSGVIPLRIIVLMGRFVPVRILRLFLCSVRISVIRTGIPFLICRVVR
jgi:hypothetical protein